MRAYVFFILLSISVKLFAFPSGCQSLEVSDSLQIKKLTPLVVFYNETKAPIYLTYKNTRGDAHAGYSTEIKAKHYSLAYIAKDFDMSYNCVESGYGYAQQVSCKKVISACRFEKPFKGLEKMQAFWLLENVPKSVLEEKLASYQQASSDKN